MAYCRNCNERWDTDVHLCPVCGAEIEDDDAGLEETEWKMIGTLEEKPSADLAREVLKSSGIPAVVISRSGFFGNLGLRLDGLYSGRPGSFELSVPIVCRKEASEILDATLGDKWQRSED